MMLAAIEKPLQRYFSHKKNYRTTGLFGRNTIQFAKDIAGFGSGIVCDMDEGEHMDEGSYVALSVPCK